MKISKFLSNHSSNSNFLIYSFFLLVITIPILQPNLIIFGQRISLPDFIFTGVILILGFSIISGKTTFRWHRIYWVFLFYFLAMLISLIFSRNNSRGLSKLLGETYLIGLAIITYNIVKTISDLKMVCMAWLAGTFFVTSLATISVLLFYIDPQNPILEHTLTMYGAVPVGNYPRVLSTFYSASLFCNYLTCSLGILFISDYFKWISDKFFYILYFLIWLSAVYTVSSGLGGIICLVGIWIWFIFRKKNPSLSKLFFSGGIFSAIFFYLMLFIALQSYRQVPYSFTIPFIEKTIFPSSRVLVWTEALQTFLNNPITGVGIGNGSVNISFTNTDGSTSLLIDAHNIFLSVATQTGLIGLSAFLLMIFFILREFLPFKFSDKKISIIPISLGLAFIFGFIYQGLFGSFEDARHIWIWIGLILSFGKNVILLQNPK
jgi:O-antigen ligase